ncbi:MAG: serine/threonine protein kinase, partial [Myxococcales bacterium]|nr:serine/threonine protein kinase [Myxococcales bacterium]
MANATTALETDLEHLPADTRVGEYLIEQLIGVGGFARVYRAHHPVLGTRVAVKVITRALALDPEAIQRFVLEAQAASRITHPGVVRILDYGKLLDGRAYQVMELIEGPALDHHLDRVGRVPLDQALRLLAEIAAALDAAHDAGIVHRDLKPANVLLAPAADGPSARLADFGIAKALETEGATPQLTRTGTTLGTPAYMSPEQALGRAVGKPSDVYAFGVVAFELITGRVPFAGETPFETMMMHVQTPAPMPSAVCVELGPRFDAAMGSLLAKHPEQRPTTLAAAMAMLREELVASAPVAASSHRRPRVVAAGLAVLALAAV